MTFHTHCDLRLGDNLAAIQLVRKLAQQHPEHHFKHALNVDYMGQMAQLYDVICDLPNITVASNHWTRPSDSVDLWKGQNGFFYQHPKSEDYVAVMLDFYALSCARLGLPCPITSAKDMLFDYPALLKSNHLSQPFDWLVINSPPLSGQFPNYNADTLERIIKGLRWRGYSVVTTAKTRESYGQTCTVDHNLTATGIGNLSLHCKYILMVSTGVSWPTFNIWNQESVKLRIILLERERVELSPNTVHCNSAGLAHELLHEQQFL